MLCSASLQKTPPGQVAGVRGRGREIHDLLQVTLSAYSVEKGFAIATRMSGLECHGGKNWFNCMITCYLKYVKFIFSVVK